MAYITTEDVKAIREELKAAFPAMRFSVRRDHYSAVIVSIMKGPKELETLFADDEYSVKSRYQQLNHFHPHMYGEHEDLITKISEITHNAPGRAGGSEYFDKSDSMTDYFHTAFYVNIHIGKWNKPFEVK